jgi:hypothetical protein
VFVNNDGVRVEPMRKTTLTNNRTAMAAIPKEGEARMAATTASTRWLDGGA